MIRAPFNFVPLAENVFFPDWAKNISQDIPFNDGMSGVLDIELTAMTPLFVRNGHTKEQQENKAIEYRTFSTTPDGRYFIPATTIKGAVRNALEILSFGKMSRVDNKRYSIRDLKLKKDYLEKFSTKSIHCGWMRKEGSTIIIEDHGLPYRISHWTIDLKYHTPFCSSYEGQTGKKYLANEKHKIARDKYKMFGDNSLVNRFAENGTCTNNPVDSRMCAKFDDNGWEGTIVFTGQPGERKPREENRKASGKFFEFVFKEEVQNSYTLDMFEEKGLFEDFCFIYKDSEDWAWWQHKLNDGERVPVFLNAEGGKLNHFGLSYLYKLPTALHVKEYLNENHLSMEPDLAECMFGYSQKDKALKGRIQFSHAVCAEGELDEENSVYMGSPKPTYYPIYIKQKGRNGFMLDEKDRVVDYSTMLSKGAQLKGWKMYPIRKEAVNEFDIPEGQEDNCNPFLPIKAGSRFVGKVIFHNLKQIELAALVYALSLKNDALHSIGFAKPFGYGATKIKVNSINGGAIDVEAMRIQFEEFMSNQIAGYSKTKQVREFFAMSKPQALSTNHALSYMELDEFVFAKQQHPKKDKNYKEGDYLVYYSEMIKREERAPVAMTAKALVDFFSGGIKFAHLIDDKDASKKDLIVEDKKVKLKIGDTIEVEKIMKGSKVQKLLFIRKK